MRSPIVYFGGKGNFVKKILPLIPAHRIYVEVFGGGASLLFAKDPSPVEVYNDIDSAVVDFFRVLRDKESFKRFYRMVALTPYAREEYYFNLKNWGKPKDKVEKAYRWFVMVRFSFSGLQTHGWSYSFKSSARNMARTVSGWLSAIEGLPDCYYRFMRVQIENLDFRDLIKNYDSEETFMYLDPPYIQETRKRGGYRFEMSEKDHRDLAELLLKSKSKFILSGYRHKIYKPLEEKSWVRIDFKTSCYAVGRTRYTGLIGEGVVNKLKPRIESVWLSPNCQPANDSLFPD